MRESAQGELHADRHTDDGLTIVSYPLAFGGGARQLRAGVRGLYANCGLR